MVKKRVNTHAPQIAPPVAREIDKIRREWSEQAVESAYAKKATSLPANWEAIRNNIKRGDKGRCCVCGNPAEYARLTVHHRDSNESNNRRSNLMTVCMACHEKFPEPPFSESFYCKTISHNYPTHVVCIRFGRKFGMVPDPRMCPFHDDKHGCLAVAVGLAKDARDRNN